MRRFGFTLIEVLVVVAVIGILVAIVSPLMMVAKAHTRRVICASNLRQLLLSFSLYEQDAETYPYGFCDLLLEGTNLPPPDGECAGYMTHDRAGWWWFNYLQNMQETDMNPGSHFWCPSRKLPGISVERNILCGNYGVNRSVCVDAVGISSSPFVAPPVKASAIKNPSLTLLITDSGYSLVSWMAGCDSGTAPFENPQRLDAFYIPGLELNQTRSELLDNRDAIKGRHPNQTLNVGYIDGHVEPREADFLACDPNLLSGNHSPSLWIP